MEVNKHQSVLKTVNILNKKKQLKNINVLFCFSVFYLVKILLFYIFDYTSNIV
jgi:hypothetical protein